MSDTAPRFALPLLASGQAQKEITHNEAIVRLDGLLHAALESRTLTTPPATPAVGALWLVPVAGATGAWAGQGGKLALSTSGGWRFVAPPAGLMLWSKPDGGPAVFDGATWHWGHWPVAGLAVAGQPVVGPRQPAIPGPSGGATIDAEGRAAISAILTALRNQGLINS
jgi:hypothetical protein